MKPARLLITLCVAILIAGCGQKGPLVRPDAPKHKKVILSPGRAPSHSVKPADAPPKP
ncbi:MAG: lipoprotein [Gammaproteobacteria bacterium]